MRSQTKRASPTIREVARACGVSASAVSFVLNDKPGQVSPETRERVLRAVREMGYRLRAAEAAPENPAVATLGVIAGVPGDSLVGPGYYHSILNGLLSAADAHRLNLVVFTHSLFHADPHPNIRVYCDGRCDGVFVIAPSVGSPLVEALQERGFPFVAVGDDAGDDLTPSVDVDNPGAARRATEYLIARGHRRIGFVGGPGFVRSAVQRRDAFRVALARHGLAPDPYLIVDGHHQPQIQRRVQEMLQLPPGRRPTALLGWQDGAVRDCLPLLRERGLRVPEDVSLIGINDDPGVESLTPPLTTLRQPYREIGRAAVEVMLARIASPRTSAQHVLLPAEMVERASVGPAPG